MLEPGERIHLFEMLRPPAGRTLDSAVGTTYSLDLLSLLTLPLSFALLDREGADGSPQAEPLALLEALRRYADRMTIFCQACQIKVLKKYQPLVTWLEPAIFEVLTRDRRGVFHPKVWVMRFVAPKEPPVYRMLCLSRNLTSDRCWDTAVVLDGEVGDREVVHGRNRPLADFVAELPKLSQRKLDPVRRAHLSRLAAELPRVDFDLPEGFHEYRFWRSGFDGKRCEPFGQRCDRSVVIAPFVSDDVLRGFTRWSGGPDGGTHLVSRRETLQRLDPANLRACSSVHELQAEVVTEDAADDEEAGPGEVLNGLHAKVYVIDHGWDTSVFTGSFNATAHAFRHNVEFMVELIGKRSRFGVREFLRQVQGETRFVDLLQPYEIDLSAAPPGAVADRLEELLREAQRALAEAGAHLGAQAVVAAGVYDLTLHFYSPVQWPHAQITARAWPISLPEGQAKALDGAASVVFKQVSLGGLTPLVAFAIHLSLEGQEQVTRFVMNLPLDGAPADRRARLMAELLSNKERVLRYILFLLAASEERVAGSSELAQLLAEGADGAAVEFHTPGLLETMVRAMHRDPKSLADVDELLRQLRQTPNGSELVSEEFEKIWRPIREASRT